jgi:NDMA-dependent alcohol dehydrogenase
MKTKGALLFEPGTRSGWEVEEIEIDPPKEGEVLVKMAASGLCHSDDHLDAGDCQIPFKPVLGGHEGSGIVEQVGPGVTELAPGDHVVTTFVPLCGHCHWCQAGRGNLCDMSAGILSGLAPDGTHRIHSRGLNVGAMAYLGTFSPYICATTASLIKIPDEIPLVPAALVGCGVPTGWGSAVYAADTQIGDTVVIVGTGGVGMNAVQGARMAGAANVVAVDPVDYKRKRAYEFGATHDAASIEEAYDVISELTDGVMAARGVFTAGLANGELINPYVNLMSKGGVCVITSMAPMSQSQITLDLFALSMWEKQLRGTIFGNCNPRVDIPRLLSLYQKGTLLLDELVTKTYPLEDINEAYADMANGKNLRGVIVYD